MLNIDIESSQKGKNMKKIVAIFTYAGTNIHKTLLCLLLLKKGVM